MRQSPALRITAAMAFMSAVLAAAACTPDQRIINSSRTPEPAAATAPAPSGFESDLETMRTADFNFIYVFRRKDGGELTPEDRRFINSQKPPEVNRVKVSVDGRAVIFGTNFRLPEPAMESLRSAYAFEDYSKPESALPPANAEPAR